VATLELTSENFDQIIGDNNFVIIDFWAEWCGPCKNFAPIYEKVSTNHEDIVFAKVDTEAQQELAGHFQIRSIPTLMVFRDQVIIFSQPGMMPEQQFEQLIEKAAELDMEAVRKEMEQQQQGSAS